MSAVATNELICVGPIKKDPRDIYDQAVAEEICRMLAGGLSLSVVCAHEGMPCRTTVYKWLSEHEDFAVNYTRARLRQADTFADQIQDIADNPFLPPALKAQMIDARKWRAARQNWRAWGDKVSHEHEHTIHPSAGPAQLPPGLGFLAGRLSKGQGGSEPGGGGVGEG